MSALATLRAREVDRVRTLIADGGLLLVYGSDAQEAAEVTSAALSASDEILAGELDVDGLTDDRQVARAIVLAATSMMLGDPRLLHLPQERRSSQQQSAWLNVYRAFGDLDVPDLVHGGWPTDVTPAQMITNAIGALSQSSVPRPVLSLSAADALVKVTRTRFNDPDALLWALRSAVQSAPRLTIVLAGGPAAIDLIQEREEAFYGWGGRSS